MPSITAQLQQVGAECGSAYRISQMIADETDPTKQQRMACEKRWQRWLAGEGIKTLSQLEADLNHLGYQITISTKS